MKSLRQRQQVVGAVSRIRDQRLRQKHLYDRRHGRVEIGRAAHSRPHRCPCKRLIQHGSYRVHASACISRGTSAFLGRETGSVARQCWGTLSETRIEPELALVESKRGWIEIKALTCSAAMGQIDCKWDEKPYGFL